MRGASSTRRVSAETRHGFVPAGSPSRLFMRSLISSKPWNPSRLVLSLYSSDSKSFLGWKHRTDRIEPFDVSRILETWKFQVKMTASRFERSEGVENKSAHGEPVEPLERSELTAV